MSTDLKKIYNKCNITIHKNEGSKSMQIKIQKSRTWGSYIYTAAVSKSPFYNCQVASLAGFGTFAYNLYNSSFSKNNAEARKALVRLYKSLLCNAEMNKSRYIIDVNKRNIPFANKLIKELKGEKITRFSHYISTNNSKMAFCMIDVNTNTQSDEIKNLLNLQKNLARKKTLFKNFYYTRSETECKRLANIG